MVTEVRGSSGSSWWGSRDATRRGAVAGVAERRGGCGRAIEGTSPGRRGPYANGCYFAMAGRGLRLAAGAREGRRAVATATTGLDWLRTTTVERGPLHLVHARRQAPWQARGCEGGVEAGWERVPWVKPWGRSVSGDRRDGLRRRWMALGVVSASASRPPQRFSYFPGRVCVCERGVLVDCLCLAECFPRVSSSCNPRRPNSTRRHAAALDSWSEIGS